MALHPPILNERLHPARVVDALAHRGREARTSTDGDLNRIIAAVVPPVVNQVLDSLDLTALVRERVDIDMLVSAVDIAAIVDRVDLDAIVDRVDVVSLAEEVVNGIDLPEIIRQSTGTMASEVVRDARCRASSPTWRSPASSTASSTDAALGVRTHRVRLSRAPESTCPNQPTRPRRSSCYPRSRSRPSRSCGDERAR